MLNLPSTFILFDTEHTAWEGSWQRKWSGPNEYKEIVQIGAIKVDNEKLVEIGSLVIFVKPKLNPDLSNYFTELTGITQQTIDKNGVDLRSALIKFKKWCGQTLIYSYGGDESVIKENCILSGKAFPLSPSQFHDIRDILKMHGIPTEKYSSGSIVEAFGKKSSRQAHDGLNDARSILDGLVELNKK